MYILLVLLLSCVSTFGQTTDSSTVCSGKADIVFVLDSSGSEGSTNFRKQLEFVKNVVNQFDIGPNNVQVAAVTFSTTATKEFSLRRYPYKNDVLNAISNIKYHSGTTNTAAALNLVRQQSITATDGARKDASKIIIVMTDGRSNSQSSTASAASHLKNTGATVLTIGIGSNLNQNELRTIATDAQHVYTVASFDALHTIQQEISTTACQTAIITDCQSKQADIVFLLDESGSVGSSNFQTQLNFVQNISESFNIGPNNVQISVVTFSDNPRNQFYLNQYSNDTDVSQAIGAISYHGGNTMTAKALQFVTANNFKDSHGARQGIPHILVVLTDGNSNNSTATRLAADVTQKAGIKVIAIGIGSGISQAELSAIASDGNHTFSVAGFDALHSILNEIQDTACNLQKQQTACDLSPADIVFLLDSSGSEGSTNFRKQLDFVANFVQQFTIGGPTGARIGLITFSTTAHQEFYLNTYTDKSAILSRIRNTRYRGGNTHTERAFQYARIQFTSSHGMRPNAKNIAIVLTDGRSQSTSTTVREASALKRLNVEIVSIGIGGNINQFELNSMATDRQHVYTVSNFDFLNTIQSELTDQTCGVTTPAPTISPDCNAKPADIVFLLDSSGSEGSTNFFKQLDFVRQFVDQFVIGPNNIQISIVLFSSRVYNQFYLNSNRDKASLKRAIDAIRYHSGNTHTEDALHYARLTSFSSTHGGRSGASKIVIVMTDGQSSTPSETRTEANRLKQVSGMKVISIGIGSNVDHSELELIASDHAHAFTVASFSSLHTITNEITFAACQTCGFLQKADIAFLLDSSGSEGAVNFGKQLNFVNRFINDFTVGPNNVQFSLARFSSSVHNEFYFNTYTSKPAVLSAVQRTSYSGGNTYTYTALRWARQNMFTAAHGARADANHFVIVLTDGASNSLNRTLTEATLLKRTGVEVLSVGIGSNLNKAELNGMASDSRHVFTVDNFNALSTIKEEIKQAACEEVSTPVPTGKTTQVSPNVSTPVTSGKTTTPRKTTTPKGSTPVTSGKTTEISLSFTT